LSISLLFRKSIRNPSLFRCSDLVCFSFRILSLSMLKIGVFGTGHLGKFHLNNWKEIEDVELVGFFDPVETIAKDVISKYGLKRFTSEDELINASDAIDVVTPTQYHFRVCEKAIKKGKHVFVEKPMANTMEEARQLVKLAQESKIKFQVGHVERFNPAFLAAKDLNLHPMFIEVHRLAQFNPRGTEVSVILDLMIHDIDVILSLVKSEVKNISASGVAVMTDTPDIANVRIEFNNGCVANLTSSRISMKKMRKIRLFQKDAYIGIDFLEKKTEVIRLATEGDENVFAFDIETPNGTKTIAIANPQVPEVNAIKRELEEFTGAIRNNTQPIVNEIDGYRAMEVAHQILQKINQNLIAS
jgi:predicted dehydrogenase